MQALQMHKFLFDVIGIVMLFSVLIYFPPSSYIINLKYCKTLNLMGAKSIQV